MLLLIYDDCFDLNHPYIERYGPRRSGTRSCRNAEPAPAAENARAQRVRRRCFCRETRRRLLAVDYLPQRAQRLGVELAPMPGPAAVRTRHPPSDDEPSMPLQCTKRTDLLSKEFHLDP